MKIDPVNESGSTLVVARWFAETPSGWLASHDRRALESIAARLAAAEQMAQALRRLYASHADFLWCAEKPAWSPPDIKWSREIHEAAETALAAWEQSK